MSSKLIRPFAVDFTKSYAPDILEVWVNFENPFDDDVRVAALEIMTTFAALGASGGLSGSDIDPGQGSINLETSKFDGTRGHWVFRDVLIDPASVCILLNMIHWLHLEVVPIRNVGLKWSAIRLLSDPLAIQFPEIWSQPSYSLNIGDLQGDIDLEIELQLPQTNSVTERVVNTMAMWLLAAHRGAFANDSFDPSESRVYLGPDVMSVTPSHIIWFIDTMRCDESSLDILFNILEFISQKIASIRRVDLGP